MKGLGNGFVMVLTCLILVPVSPHPTDLTDASFYGADLGISGPVGGLVDELIPNSPPPLDTIQDVVAPVAVAEPENLNYEDLDPNAWYDDEGGFDMDSSGASNELVDGALPENGESLMMSPSDCSTSLFKRNMWTDGNLADVEPELCPPPKDKKSSSGLWPILPPIVPQWKCDDGLTAYCCVGTLQEISRMVMDYNPFNYFCNLVWFNSLCCVGVDKQGNGFSCAEPLQPGFPSR